LNRRTINLSDDEGALVVKALVFWAITHQPASSQVKHAEEKSLWQKLVNRLVLESDVTTDDPS